MEKRSQELDAMDEQMRVLSRFRGAIVCAFLLILLIFGLVLSPSPVSQRSLDIRAITASSNEFKNQIGIEVSNASKNVVSYNLGRTVHIAFLRSGSWATNGIRHWFKEDVILNPSYTHTFTNFAEIPDGSSKVKIGVAYLSYSWRGNLAEKLPHAGFFQAVAEFLYSLDEAKRSREEWSDEYSITNLGAMIRPKHASLIP